MYLCSRFCKEFCHQCPKLFLELFVLKSVNQKVDATVGEDSNDGDVVGPATEVRRTTEQIQKKVDLVRGPTGDEQVADDDGLR